MRVSLDHTFEVVGYHRWKFKTESTFLEQMSPYVIAYLGVPCCVCYLYACCIKLFPYSSWLYIVKLLDFYAITFTEFNKYWLDLTWLGVEQISLRLSAFLLSDAGIELLLCTCHIFPELSRHITYVSSARRPPFTVFSYHLIYVLTSTLRKISAQIILHIRRISWSFGLEYSEQRWQPTPLFVFLFQTSAFMYMM